jgi:hypothetical protein
MSSLVQKLGWLARLQKMDPLNLYIYLTSAGIVWVGAFGWTFYRNPLTDDKANVWGVFSFGFIRPWILKHPIDSAKMKLSDLPPEKIAPGGGAPLDVPIAVSFS